MAQKNLNTLKNKNNIRCNSTIHYARFQTQVIEKHTAASRYETCEFSGDEISSI